MIGAAHTLVIQITACSTLANVQGSRICLVSTEHVHFFFFLFTKLKWSRGAKIWGIKVQNPRKSTTAFAVGHDHRWEFVIDNSPRTPCSTVLRVAHHEQDPLVHAYCKPSDKLPLWTTLFPHIFLRAVALKQSTHFSRKTTGLRARFDFIHLQRCEMGSWCGSKQQTLQAKGSGLWSVMLPNPTLLWNKQKAKALFASVNTINCSIPNVPNCAHK